ncbi:type III pantothenate kinase [Puniceicoccales bacterium CK1056]|uniref:Type III pantothenate kinase n=1 Tax=Oceanipulchritudo coccoides TaxID=2706888 RepID=A0A6B2M455_9BACT|nr:type III pantothenate kinase [Oceanipulchritudo coccoides]NDV62430.1 type III pantothenate kinase [Oceanipulchritudo coccoides]
MILCFDIGNTDIYGGVCEGRELVAEFRKANHFHPSADEFGVFVRQILSSKGVKLESLKAVAVASVVPDCIGMVREAARSYLGIDPLILKAGVKTGLKIRTNNPSEVGADRIANAIAAVELYPAMDRIVVDMGTATTFCAINQKDEYLGGVICAGMGLSMKALAQNTAKLPYVDLVRPGNCLGKTTVESIQNGLYFSHLGLIREVVGRLKEEAFEGREPVVIGTGGHAGFFREESLLSAYVPDLVLRGLCRAVELNSTL